MNKNGISIENALLRKPDPLYALPGEAGAVLMRGGDAGAIKKALLSVYGDIELKEGDSYRRIGEGDLIRVEKQGYYVYYHGFVSRPGIGYISKAEDFIPQCFYINGRYVEDDVLAAALAGAYKNIEIKNGLYPPDGSVPLACLFLTIKPYRLDEFVSGGRNAVRYYSPDMVGSFCKDAVIEALLSESH